MNNYHLKNNKVQSFNSMNIKTLNNYSMKTAIFKQEKKRFYMKVIINLIIWQYCKEKLTKNTENLLYLSLIYSWHGQDLV